MNLTTKNKLSKYSELVLRYRWLFLTGSLLLCFLASFGMKNLKFNNDHRILFSPDNPLLVAFEKLEQEFSRDDVVAIGISSKEGTVYKKQTLEAIYELTEKLWLLPYSTRVDSLTNYLYMRAEGDDLIVEEVLESPDDLSPSKIKSIESIVDNDPAIAKRLVSANKMLSVIATTFQLPVENPNALLEVTAQARKIIKELQQRFPDIHVYLSGNVVMGSAFAEVSAHDLTTLVPLMYVVILVLLIVSLRSIMGMLVTLIVVILSSTTALGIAGWLGWDISVSTANAPTIIMTLAVADSIHFLVGVLLQQKNGLSKPEAIIKSLCDNFVPIFFTSATTAVGFLSMNFMDIPPFRDLGNIVTFGVTAAFFLVITFVPALISITPFSAKNKGESAAPIFSKIAEFVISSKGRIVTVFTALTIFLALMIPKMIIDDSIIDYFDPSLDFRKAAEKLDQDIGGINRLEYAITAGGANDISSPEYLQKLDEFAAYALSLDKVSHVQALPETIRQLNYHLHGDNEQWNKIPASREEAAQYLLLYEMSLPEGRDLNNRINSDRSATRVTINLSQVSTREVLAVIEKLDHWLETNTPKVMHAKASGISVIFANLYADNTDEMLKGTLVALFVITLFLIVSLRSVEFGVLSIVPNCVPIILAYGLWYFIDGYVGLSTSAVAMASIGIVVDDTVHFLSKYLMFRRQVQSAEQSVRETFRAVGPSLWTTSLILAAGFSILALSTFALNKNFGILVTVTVVVALIADFLLLPALLLYVDKKIT